jgi:hypothetical protein
MRSVDVFLGLTAAVATALLLGLIARDDDEMAAEVFVFNVDAEADLKMLPNTLPIEFVGHASELDLAMERFIRDAEEGPVRDFSPPRLVTSLSPVCCWPTFNVVRDASMQRHYWMIEPYREDPLGLSLFLK